MLNTCRDLIPLPLNDQHGKSSTQFTDQELLLKIPTDNSVRSHTSNADKMTCRLSRVGLFLQVGCIQGRNVEDNLPEFLTGKLSNFLERQCIPSSSRLKL